MILQQVKQQILIKRFAILMVPWKIFCSRGLQTVVGWLIQETLKIGTILFLFMTIKIKSCNSPSAVFIIATVLYLMKSGKYLYVVMNESFQPYYSDQDNTFIYANSGKIGVISLKNTPSIIAPKMIQFL